MITLKDVCFGYECSKPVLDNISLDVSSGQIYGLLGKNGEGKTTFLRLLSGLLFADKGSCLVCNMEPSKREAHFLQQIFLLPEEIMLPDVTGLQYIKMYAPFYPTFSQDILKACIEAFEVDFSMRLAKMSLGQKKKVAITLALAAHTPLLLMDEPTNGLDIPSKSTFRRLVASFTEEQQTVIISTHQVRDLESLIDSVILLDQKHILLNETVGEISRKLSFKLLSADEKAFYSESTPAGTMGVVLNRDDEDTPVSLELLFNAAILQPEKMKSLFNSNSKNK